MKKVRMILSAIAVVVVVGGALAFTPRDQFTVCYNDNISSNTCPTLGHFNSGGNKQRKFVQVPPGGCETSPNCSQVAFLQFQ